MRWWAFWRRVQYITGMLLVYLVVGIGVYFIYFTVPPTCTDGMQNADERGIDCGGACNRICTIDVLPPIIEWSRSLRVADGQYNAIAYVQNKNINAGTPEMKYTFTVLDNEGVITERNGVTVLPPNSVYPIFEGRINTGNREPTQTFIEFEFEDADWLPAEVGREQFIIEGRSLKNADDKPRLDAQVRNTELTDARDVEVVATIFDINGNALTSSRTVVPFITARSTESIVFTWPEPIATTVRSCEVPTDVVVGIDLSGSMNDDNDDPPEPISSVLSSASSFAQRLKEKDQISVVSYATGAILEQKLTENIPLARSTIEGLSIAPEEEVGSTNTGDAIVTAMGELSSERHNLDARKVLVLLTDGLANAPEDNPEEHAISAAKSLKDNGVTIFTIGLGEKVNNEFLRSIASSPEQHFSAASVSTLDSIYRIISGAICEDGIAVIDIVPKTATNFAPLP